MKRGVLKFFVVVAALALASLVVMFLWNAILPSVVGWGAVSYWQAMGIFILSRLLFGGAKISFMMGARVPFRRGMHSMSREQKRQYIKEYMAASEGDVK